MLSGPSHLLAPSPPHPQRCRARSTTPQPRTSPLGVEQREHVALELDNLRIGTIAWRKNTHRQRLRRLAIHASPKRISQNNGAAALQLMSLTSKTLSRFHPYKTHCCTCSRRESGPSFPDTSQPQLHGKKICS
jgi:hypothetical protein